MTFPVIPAQAGIYLQPSDSDRPTVLKIVNMDSRFRGNDGIVNMDSRFRGNDEVVDMDSRFRGNDEVVDMDSRFRGNDGIVNMGARRRGNAGMLYSRRSRSSRIRPLENHASH